MTESNASANTGGALAQTRYARFVTDEETGVTYYFNKAYQVGQYNNGDWFVVSGGEDVVITKITPESRVVDALGYASPRTERVINGADLQPTEGSQGFDSFVINFRGVPYARAENVDPGVRDANLVISASKYPGGASLVKAISVQGDPENPAYTRILGERSAIQSYSVLTVTPEVPPEGAFRPPVRSTDKTSYWTEDDIDYSVLQNLDPVEGQLDISEYSAAPNLYMSWNTENDPSRSLFARDSGKYGYAGYNAVEQTDALLALHTNYTDEQKRDLAIEVIQTGIDLYGTVMDGGVWRGIGGNDTGRKVFVTYAAVMLGDEGMKEMLDPAKAIWNEDLQLFYVSEDDLDRTISQGQVQHGNRVYRVGYEDIHLGLPEWGVEHVEREQMDSSLINTNYRLIVAAAFPGTALALSLLEGGKEAWDNELFFEYTDRIMYSYLSEYAPVLPSRTGGSQAWNRLPAVHRPSDLQFDWFEAYREAATNWVKWTGLPEHMLAPQLTANGAGLTVDLNDFRADGGLEILRADIRYSTDGETWKIIEDVPDTFVLAGLESDTVYYVQSRLVNENGAGAWSSNVPYLTNGTRLEGVKTTYRATPKSRYGEPIIDVNEVEAAKETAAEPDKSDGTPVVDTPVVDPVVTPVDETPVDETPVVETPVDETPVDETPVVETPVDETPVIETPVVVKNPVKVTEIVADPARVDTITATGEDVHISGFAPGTDRLLLTEYGAGALRRFEVVSEGLELVMHSGERVLLEGLDAADANQVILGMQASSGGQVYWRYLSGGHARVGETIVASGDDLHISGFEPGLDRLVLTEYGTGALRRFEAVSEGLKLIMHTGEEILLEGLGAWDAGRVILGMEASSGGHIYWRYLSGGTVTKGEIFTATGENVHISGFTAGLDRLDLTEYGTGALRRYEETPEGLKLILHTGEEVVLEGLDAADAGQVILGMEAGNGGQVYWRYLSGGHAPEPESAQNAQNAPESANPASEAGDTATVTLFTAEELSGLVAEPLQGDNDANQGSSASDGLMQQSTYMEDYYF